VPLCIGYPLGANRKARRFSDSLFAIYFPECVEMFECDAGSDRSKIVQEFCAVVQRVDSLRLGGSQGRRNLKEFLKLTP
jgi:hypothetical protein